MTSRLKCDLLTYLETIHNNSTLQFRPVIPHRLSGNRMPTSHNLLVVSQVHNHYEQKYLTRQLDSDLDHDEGIDSTIGSRSLSINTVDENQHEVKKTQYSRRVFCKRGKFRPSSPRRKSRFDQFTVVPHEEKYLVYSVPIVMSNHLQHTR